MQLEADEWRARRAAHEARADALTAGQLLPPSPWRQDLCVPLFRLAVPLLVASCLVVACGEHKDGPNASAKASATPTTRPSGVDVRTERFWAVIADARRGADGDVEAMHDSLLGVLRGYDKAEVAQFQQVLAAQSRRVYTWNHGDVAELVCGYLGDDGYTDFRSWMIAQGQETFEAFVRDPDTLADVDGVRDACEGSGEIFAAAVSERYEDLGGVVGEDEEFPILELFEPPAGEKLSRDKIAEAFPRTAARFR